MQEQATIQFIREHAADDVRMLALHKNKYPDVDMEFALQQIEGRQRTKDKLPEIYQIKDWHYPIRLSLEQCSSETTAKYKVQVLSRILSSPQGGIRGGLHPSPFRGNWRGLDLTGGFGIDTFYLSQLFQETHYVERNAELCAIAKHNFSLTERNIVVHNAQAEDFLTSELPNLQTSQPLNLPTAIYLDPARRSASGRKVFRLQDCEPDLTVLYPLLMSKCKVLMVKLSPMLDITEALRHLPDAREVHIVAVKNEVKEILILCYRDDALHSSLQVEPKRIAVNLESNDAPFIFTEVEESAAPSSPQGGIRGGLLYEPNAAILKAGAFRSVGARYGLQKLAVNTHLYASDRLIEDFPGRIFKILGTPDKAQLKALQKTGAHTICRNYPLSADKLAAKHKIKEGGTLYLIGTTIERGNLSPSWGNKKGAILLLAERVR